MPSLIGWLLACRLRDLSEILDKHVSYFRAAVALESLGSPTDEEPGSEAAGDPPKDQLPPDDDASQKAS